MYLLAYDTEKDRLTARSQLGLVVRAAALAELYLEGRLTDERGTPRAVDLRPPGDMVLDAVLEQVADGRRRRWHRWIVKHQRPTLRAVRDQLEAGRWITVRRRTLLPDKVELRERQTVKQYADGLRDALLAPTARVDPRVAAALALAANGEMETVVTRRQRREHKERLAELAEHTGPVACALRTALRAQRSAAASAAVAGAAAGG
jgi:hypothetical protein